jgi:hypothetical protein
VTLPTPELASELRAAPTLQRHLVEPQPSGPVLVFAEAAPRAAIVRALERLGVQVEVASSTPPTPPRKRARIA